MPFTLSRRRLLRAVLFTGLQNDLKRIRLLAELSFADSKLLHEQLAECRLVEVWHISLMNISTLCPSSLSLSSSLLPSFSLSKHGAAAPLEVRVVTLEFVAINQGGNYASGKYE